jgi:outer membrane protein assembly factor BamB
MRRTSSLILTILTAMIAACAPGLDGDGTTGGDQDALAAGQVAAPWAKSRQNARNTSASSLGAQNPDVLWRYGATAGGPGTNVNSDPVIDAQGNVYFGGREGATSLSSSGQVRWTFKTPASSVVYAIQLLTDGSALVNSSNGAIYKVSQATGAFQWGLSTGTQGGATPMVVGADGTIYFGSESTGELFAVSSAGTVKWSTKLGGSPVGSPAIRSDGLIYVAVGAAGTSQPAVQIVDPRRARVVWTWKAPKGTAAFVGGVAVTPKDQAIVASYYNGKVFAIDPKKAGGLLWTHESIIPGVDYWSAPIVGADGTIYVGEGGVLGKDGDKRVVALSPEGVQKWATTVRGEVDVAMALSRDGVLYAMSMAELPNADAELRLTALTAATGQLRFSVELPADGVWPSVNVAPALGHGRVYVGINEGYTDGFSQSGSLFAIGAATLVADYGEADPVPVPTTKPGVIKLDTTLYTPQMGFAAWMPKGSAVTIDNPPMDVAPKAGFTWAWFGAKEGWVQTSAVTIK